MFSLLAMAEVFVLLLGEIDLSVGFVAGVAGAVMADLDQPRARLAMVALAVAVALLTAQASACFRARSSPASGCPRSW